MGTMAGTVAAGALGEAARRWWSGESASYADVVLNVANAERIADTLSRMRGAAMKLGQLLSLEGGTVLPQAFTDALTSLQASGDRMSPAQLHGVLGREYGHGWRDRFSEFEEEPFATASIGQVHRAVTHSGVEVAVKIQYPGVDAAIRADLENTDMLFGALGMLFNGLDPKPIVEELTARLTEELDYEREAANQRFFAEYYRDHPTIAVPEVIDELSTVRVLTSQFVTGSKWSEVLTWSEEQRNQTAETLYRYAFGGIYRLGAFNGDPHPGNYLCAPDGRITFLDYGLCKFFTDAEIGQFEAMIRSMVLEHDLSEVRRVWRQAGVLTDDSAFTDEEIGDYFGHFFEQVMEPGTRTITKEYAAESLRRYLDVSGPHGDIMRAVTLPSFLVIIQRINLGLYALFGELNATGDWRGIAEEIWPLTDALPSTVLGARIREWELATGKRSADGTALAYRAEHGVSAR